MLPKENRLSKEKDFERVFAGGKSFKEKKIVLKKAENNLDFSRFGFIVGKRVSLKAVERNRIKRKMRESAKTNNLKKGYDAVVIALPGIKEDEIENDMRMLFKKSRMFKNEENINSSN